MKPFKFFQKEEKGNLNMLDGATRVTNSFYWDVPTQEQRQELLDRERERRQTILWNQAFNTRGIVGSNGPQGPAGLNGNAEPVGINESVWLSRRFKQPTKKRFLTKVKEFFIDYYAAFAMVFGILFGIIALILI